MQHRAEGGSWSATQTLTSAATQRASLPGLNKDVPYEWRVRSTHPGATSDWATASYRTIPHAAGIPQQVAPADPGPRVSPNPTLDWADTYSAIASQDFEGSNPDWRSGRSGQSVSTERAHSGNRSLRLEASTGCDPNCAFSVPLHLDMSELDRTATYRFSGWIYRKSGTASLYMRIKHRSPAGWEFEPTSTYTNAASWQYLSTTVDMSTIPPDTDLLSAFIVHHGSGPNPAYIDDLTLERVSGPPAPTYEVNMYSVKTDGTTAEHTTSTVNSSAAQLSGLRTSTTYVWRVRGTTDGGTGPWSAYHRMQTQTMSRVADAGRLPADNDTVRIVKGGTQSFSWDPVPDATHYRIQIVGPGSRGAEPVYVDSTLTDTNISVPRDLITREQLSWSTAQRSRTESSGAFRRFTTGERE